MQMHKAATQAGSATLPRQKVHVCKEAVATNTSTSGVGVSNTKQLSNSNVSAAAARYNVGGRMRSAGDKVQNQKVPESSTQMTEQQKIAEGSVKVGWREGEMSSRRKKLLRDSIHAIETVCCTLYKPESKVKTGVLYCTSVPLVRKPSL